MTIGECISHGKDGAIFRICPDTVAKFYRSEATSTLFDFNQHKAYHEYSIANLLYNNEISVPQPLDYKKIAVPQSNSPFSQTNRGLHVPAFCMEHIDGERIDKLPITTYRKAMELRSHEMDKVRDLGVLPHDCAHPGNTLWSQDQERVYLIDFTTWLKPSHLN